MSERKLCRKHCGSSAPAAPTTSPIALIERCGHAAECKHSVTFDQNAATGVGMRLLG